VPAEAMAQRASRGNVTGIPPDHLQLIPATTTDTGLKVECEIGANTYPAGLEVSDAEIEAINIR